MLILGLVFEHGMPQMTINQINNFINHGVVTKIVENHVNFLYSFNCQIRFSKMEIYQVVILW